MVSTLLAMALFFIWVIFSPNNILDLDPRCMFYLTGTVFANICCKLIIAQMSNTRSELFSMILLPTLAAVVLVLVVPGLSRTGELLVMYGLTGLYLLYCRNVSLPSVMTSSYLSPSNYKLALKSFI